MVSASKVADVWFGRNRRRPFVSKQIFVTAEQNDRLHQIGKAEGKKQQKLINEMIDEGIAKREVSGGNDV